MKPLKIPGIGVELKDEMFDFLTYEQMKEYVLSPGYVFYFPRKGNPKMILRAGESVRDSLVESLTQRGVKNFKVYKIIDTKKTDSIVSKIRKLKLDNDEEVRLLAREEILLWFKKIYWDGVDNGALLDLILSMNKEFYDVPDYVMDKILTTGLTFYNRAFRIASFSVISLLILGCYDYQFLKEFYNTCLVLDYGLFEMPPSYHVIKAIETEHTKSGSGLHYLNEKNVSLKDKETFIQHVNVYLDSATSEEMTYPELLNLISLHHELSDGSGFPKGLKAGELLDFETVVCFMDRMFGFENLNYLQGDGKSFFKNQLLVVQGKREQHNVGIERVVGRIFNYFDSDVKKERAA